MYEEITKEQLAAEYQALFHYVRYLTQNEVIAADITQETFLRALKSSSKFQGESSLYTWLCGIAKHIWLDYLKKHKKEELDDSEPQEISGKSLEEMLMNKESTRELHKIIHNLKEPYKEVFSLRVFGELSLKEISELFGKSESWARVTYHRATKMIVDQVERGRNV